MPGLLPGEADLKLQQEGQHRRGALGPASPAWRAGLRRCQDLSGAAFLHRGVLGGVLCPTIKMVIKVFVATSSGSIAVGVRWNLWAFVLDYFPSGADSGRSGMAQRWL